MKRTFKTSLTAGVSALCMTAGVAAADIVQADDVIIDGSLCVGLDCVNGESFGFDTVRLKENNLRIHFQDTSASASFPTTDWRIVINDSTNGGQNKFAIEDSDRGRQPFTIEGGAPVNSLYVDDGGRVGFGTSTPLVNLHVKTGNTPTLRLEQDGSSGFAAQTWDVASNETNFFIRDASNGSTLPFRIQPSAPTNSIYIADDGNIGLGTTSPEDQIHIKNAGATNFRFEDSTAGVSWASGLAANDTFKISAVGTAGVQFRFTRDGGLALQAQATPPVTSVADGMLYYDTSGALCVRIGGAWVAAAGAGTCS